MAVVGGRLLLFFDIQRSLWAYAPEQDDFTSLSGNEGIGSGHRSGVAAIGDNQLAILARGHVKEVLLEETGRASVKLLPTGCPEGGVGEERVPHWCEVISTTACAGSVKGV